MRSAEKWPIETRKTIDVSLVGMISSFVAVIGKLGFGHKTCMLALPIRWELLNVLRWYAALVDSALPAFVVGGKAVVPYFADGEGVLFE